MTVHKLKYQGKELCDAVYSGRKMFELRYNDRDYQVGDIIIPKSIDEDCEPLNHPIDNCMYKIVYIMDHYLCVLKEGWCILGVEYAGRLTLSGEKLC